MKRITKLSEFYKQIGNYLKQYGDADILSIATHSANEEHIRYSLNLTDIDREDFTHIGTISVCYEDKYFTDCRGHRAECGIIDWSDCNIGVSNKEIDEAIKPFVLPDKCVNCEYARQACADEYIGCAYWTKEREEELYGLNDDIHLYTFERRLMRECEIKGVAQGWVFLSRRPEHEQASTDTVSQGLMTNNVYVFKKDFCCKYFKNR